MTENVKVGQKVKDNVSGLIGIVLARTDWLYGCVRLTIQPEGNKDGKPFETFTVDEPQVTIVEETRAEVAGPEPATRKHGERPEATRREEPSR